MKPQFDEAEILALDRPDKALWTYYLLRLILIPPIFPILVLPAWFRYHTMRYRFTTEGISMSWGILFRREIIVNYARIQDIHLESNIVERWLGLARILVQTASGNAAAELTIEGLKQFGAVRDFLYSRMRGVKDHTARMTSEPSQNGTSAELVSVLQELSREVRAIRSVVEERGRSRREERSDV